LSLASAAADQQQGHERKREVDGQPVEWLLHLEVAPEAALAWDVLGAEGAGGAAGRPERVAVLAVAGAIAFAAYLLTVRSVRQALSTRAIVTRTYSYAAIAAIVAAVAVRQPFPAAQATTAWAGILGMALVSQLLGHTALNAALRYFSANAVAFSTMLEPVSAAVLAFIIFSEPLPVATIFGGALVLLAIAIAIMSDHRDRMTASTTLGVSGGGG